MNREQIQAWVEWQAELTEADLEHLVFCDEAAVLTTMMGAFIGYFGGVMQSMTPR